MIDFLDENTDFHLALTSFLGQPHSNRLIRHAAHNCPATSITAPWWTQLLDELDPDVTAPPRPPLSKLVAGLIAARLCDSAVALGYPDPRRPA